MKSTVEPLSETRVRLEIEVPFAELEPNLKKAYREIGAKVVVPGFRRGKVPAAVLDQRVGRSAILNEAVQEAIPEQLVAAIREHEVQTLGRPSLQTTEFVDGKQLRFVVDVDIRPQVTLPDLGGIEVVVEGVQVTETETDEAVDALRDRFATLKNVDRAAARGDFVQIDLATTVDGVEVPGGAFTNISHEVGADQLMPGLDEHLEGMRPGEATTFTTTLVQGDFAGREAEVSVTVRTVKEREVPPADDAFAQLASEFDTLPQLRADLANRLLQTKRIEQVVEARDKAMAEVVAAVDVPVPEGVVQDEIDARKQAVTDQLARMGASLEGYLASEGKTMEQYDEEVTSAAQERVRIQLVLDALADAQDIRVTDEEYGQEIVHRAELSRMSPEQYYEQVMRNGLGPVVYTEVRRGKALAALLRSVSVKDTAGEPVSLKPISGDDEDGDSDAHPGHD